MVLAPKVLEIVQSRLIDEVAVSREVLLGIRVSLHARCRSIRTVFEAQHDVREHAVIIKRYIYALESIKS